MAPDDRSASGCLKLMHQNKDLTGIVAICSKARSRQALLISRSLRASSSWANGEDDAVSFTTPLGS